MDNKDITSVIKRFEKGFNEIKNNIDLIKHSTKEVLTLKEVAEYTGLSRSYLYKLTMSQQIPFYRPNGKCLYFNRQELEQWLQSNRVSTQAELAQNAQTYCMKGGRK